MTSEMNLSTVAEDMHAGAAEAEERDNVMRDTEEPWDVDWDDALAADEAARAEMEDRHLDAYWEAQHEVMPEFFGGE